LLHDAHTGSNMEPSQQSVTVVVKGYPRLSETFIAQEIYALQSRGLRMRIASLRRPTDPASHPVHAEIHTPILYLPEYLYQDPRRVLSAWRCCRRRKGYRVARNAWLSDLSKDPTPNRVRRFGQALVLSAELPADVGFLYAHFLHTPASVTRYAGLMSQIPWACSAHAKDIWTTPEWEKRQKLRECRWLVTCTSANLDHLRSISDDPLKASLIYHGLDFGRFDDPGRPAESVLSSGHAAGPVEIVSVGRAVEKKGYGDLLEALSRLPRDLDWRLVHIGGGALINRLRSAAGTLGISDRIQWRGPQPHDEVLRAYRAADIFVLSCRIAEDGDRDGLPNVLLEAQSQRLPCVSTRISGIPELVEDGVTGLLVEQKDPDSLARALQSLVEDPELRKRMGQAGFERVRERFSLNKGIDKLIRMFPESVLPVEDRILRTA